jgi:Ulp1 family protease
LQKISLFRRTSARLSYIEGDDTKSISVKRVPCSPIPRSDPNPKLLFIYPPIGANYISITSNELLRLPEGVYLNDSLVDFDLRLIFDRSSENVRIQTHIFSSFFYRKISEAGFCEMLTKVNVFEKSFIFIPINEAYNGMAKLIIIGYIGILQ